MSNKQTVVLRGKTSFAKILGAPVGNKFDDTKNWTIDLVITKDTVKELKQYGIMDRVKTKVDYLDGAPHISFRQGELKKDGSKADPIKVVDINGNAWDQNKLIGNGSDVDVKFIVQDFGPGKKKGVYIRSVRVLKLVPYNRSEFAPVDENDEFFNEAQTIAAMEADRAARDASQREAADKEFKKDFQLEEPPFDVDKDDDLDDDLAL